MAIKSIPPAKDTLAGASKLEKRMAGDWRQAFFELITNFPWDAEYIFYKCRMTSDGMRITIYQDGNGTKMETVAENITTDDDDLAISNIKTRVNGGSMFGIGTANINYHVLDYLFKCRDDNSDFTILRRNTGEIWSETLDVDDKWKVIQDFVITDSRGVTYQYKIEEFQKIIGYVDAVAISGKHKNVFSVEGISPEVDKHLSGEVEASLCIWNKKDKSGIPIPEHNNLYAVDGTPITELVIETYDNDNNKSNLKLNIVAMGRRSENNDLFHGIDDVLDIPYAVIYLNDGRRQLVGRIPLRTRKGRYHLNGVVVVATVSKDDIRNFFASPDKFKGFVPNFEKAVRDRLVDVVENTYEDNDTKEKVRQLFLFDIIVNDKFGDDVYEDEASEKRKLLGIDFLNNLTISERLKLVTMEAWTTKSVRLDILVRCPKKYVDPKMYNGFKEDVYTVIEMKKEDFNVLAIRQGTDQVQKKGGAVQLYGVSVGVTQKNRESFNTELGEINASNQRRLGDLQGSLIDLNEHGFMFKTFEQYYREKVEEKLNDLKDD